MHFILNFMLSQAFTFITSSCLPLQYSEHLKTNAFHPQFHYFHRLYISFLLYLYVALHVNMLTSACFSLTTKYHTEILSTSNRIPTRGQQQKKVVIYFLLIVTMVLLLWHHIVLLWYQVTMVASEQHLHKTIVLPRTLATGSIHDYLFCYCPLVGILFEVLIIVPNTIMFFSVHKREHKRLS